MRIDCPVCNAAYDVPPERVPPGRLVRCARCNESWAPVALVDAEPPVPLLDPSTPGPTSPATSGDAPSAAEPPISPKPSSPPEPAPEARPRPIIPPPSAIVGPADLAPPPPGRAGPLIGWVLTAALLGGGAYAAYAHRAAVMHAWPPSERVYTLLGLAP